MRTVIHVALAAYGMSGKVFHSPLIEANPHFKLDKILERTKTLSKKEHPRATIVRSYADILSDKNIDIVVINTPDIFHYEMCRQALEAGKNVIVEKPFTQSVSEAEELIDLAKKKGLILTVFQSRRLDGDFITIQKLIEKKSLGRLTEFESHFDRYRTYITQNTWKETGNEKIGVLYNLGSHMIDQALVLFGMPFSVTSHLDILRDNGTVPDYYDIRLQYKKFAAILKCSYLVRHSGPRYSIHGTLGSFQKWGIDPQEEALKNHHTPDEADWGKEDKTQWGNIDTDINGLHICGKVETVPGNYNLYYENLYNVLTKGEKLLVEPEQSKNGLIIMDACIKSNKDKRTIKI